ncbi:hypothetical protein PG985_006057 [Apiospora marii]|uniref:Low temperature requirement A n=1 Tax=Apiospora marii TaxID=335849 RepID=A0ABR1S6K0_9PEZI
MAGDSDLDYAGERIRLISTRIQDHRKPSAHETGHDHQGHAATVSTASDLDVPAFIKSHAASNFELFYDLWFVANLNVFASIHGIIDGATLRSFIGFIFLLWTTWLMTSIYDVRFTSESILERCCRGAHLGVMTGFAVIATSFNPEKQIASVYRAMSFFLAVSRFVLALQYALSAWQVRKFKHGRRPLFATSAFHLAAAIAYIVIAFRYEVGKNSRGYIAWYVISLVETALHLGCSQFSPVLTFIGSHFGERFNLLTLIVMGEGVIILAKNITLVVKDTYLKDATMTVWSPALIGIVTSATALIYIIFQLYFDWMHGEDESMSTRHQVWWAGLHLPFHIAMLLLVEGTNQFISWWRISESIDIASKKLLDLSDVATTSEAVANALSQRVLAWLDRNPPLDILDSYREVNTTLDSIRALPDSFWTNDTIADTDPTMIEWVDDVTELFLTMVSGIFNNFDIEAPEETKSDAKVAARDSSGVLPQSEMLDAVATQFRLVFIYAFLSAGIVLLFLTIMHIISKQRGWTPFNLFRTFICIALALGLALTTLVATNEDAVDTFMGSPWMLPIITLSYFTALVITHLPHPRRFGLGNFGRGAYKEVLEPQHASDEVPLKHVTTQIIITRPSRDFDPYEGRTGVFMSAEAGMTSPGYNATFDTSRSNYHELQSQPNGPAPGFI